MDKRKIGALALGIGVPIQMIGSAACSPPPPLPIYAPCQPAYPAGAVFTVMLPVPASEASWRICTPVAPQRFDVLVPPVLPGSGAASQVDQIRTMGGEPVTPQPGDPTGYMRGRTVTVGLIPLVGG